MFNRLSLFVLGSLVVFVTAQYPSCAQPCVGQASHGSCSLQDNACLCQDATYCNTTNDCFRTSCSYSDWTAAYNYSVQLCNQAGVTQSNTQNPPKKRAVTPAHLHARMHKARL